MRLSTLALLGLLLGVSEPARAALWPSAVIAVERDLRSPDVALRRRAAQSLRDLPAQSAARLSRAALDDADVDVRLTALDACLDLGLPGLGERLVPWLSDGERRLRLSAAEALSESPSPAAVPSLGRALADADVAVRSAAAGALGRTRGPEAVLALLGHLDDPVPEVRRDVARALGELSDARAVVPLIGKIQDARPIVREAVAQALAQLSDPRSLSALELTLHDSDDDVKVAALQALSALADAGSVPSIANVLRNGAQSVVLAALDALSRIHTPAALSALIAELDAERAEVPRSAVVHALARSGAAAVPALTACLNAESDPERLAGCVLALGQTHDSRGLGPIQDALRRGVLRPVPALLALSELGAPESLPTVLEYLSGADAPERQAARLAAKALLDPRRPDGRAVEPIEHALTQARSDVTERLQLLDLLGRTGSPRALSSLLAYAGPNGDATLRVHALAALGLIGETGQFPALRSALEDDSGSVRLAAALALGRLPLTSRAVQTLLERLQQSSEQDRPLLFLALGSSASQSCDPELLERLLALLQDARDGERDALIELLGRLPAAHASARLAELSESSRIAGDRAKFAEALAAHPAERARLGRLLRDANAAVRANAAWSLGETGTAADVGALTAALSDGTLSVAGNALQSLARIAQRTHGQIAGLACPRTEHPQALLRALALRALRLTGERCAHSEELTVLTRDRSEFARQSAAALLRDVPRSAADAEALARARDRDASGAVAAECEAPPATKPDGVEPTLVAVIPAAEDLPRPAQPFALLRADGLVRLGVSDRRGQVFEVTAPRGPLSLIEPAADLE